MLWWWGLCHGRALPTKWLLSSDVNKFQRCKSYCHQFCTGSRASQTVFNCFREGPSQFWEDLKTIEQMIMVYASGSAALSEICGELRISPALSAPAAQRPDPAFRSHTSQASLSLTQKFLLIRMFSLNFLPTFCSLCLLPIFTLPSWPIHPFIQWLYWLFVLVYPISLFWALRPKSRSHA